MTVKRPIRRRQAFDSFSVWILILRSEDGGFGRVANAESSDFSLRRSYSAMFTDRLQAGIHPQEPSWGLPGPCHTGQGTSLAKLQRSKGRKEGSRRLSEERTPAMASGTRLRRELRSCIIVEADHLAPRGVIRWGQAFLFGLFARQRQVGGGMRSATTGAPLLSAPAYPVVSGS